MDQAFTPGESEFDTLAREALRLRRPDGATAPTTNILSSSGSLEGFMKELVTAIGQVPRPIPEIILLSHAAESGWLEMALTDDDRNEAQFELLTRVGTALNIPEEVLAPAGGVMTPAIVRVRGCRIGIAEEFMKKLKEALKNVSTITAPKHLQAAATWERNNEILARIEFLLYCFESYPKNADNTGPMTVGEKDTRTIPIQKVVNVLKADAHKWIDGTKVPDAQWTTWLNQLKVPKKVKIDRYPMDLAVQLPTAWQVDPNEIDLNGAFVFEHVVTGNNGPFEIGKGPTKGTPAQRRAFVKGKLLDPVAFPLCFEKHEWPIWKRYLKSRYDTFASFDDFMQGFDWIALGGGFLDRDATRIQPAGAYHDAYQLEHPARQLLPRGQPSGTRWTE